MIDKVEGRTGGKAELDSRKVRREEGSYAERRGERGNLGRMENELVPEVENCVSNVHFAFIIHSFIHF